MAFSATGLVLLSHGNDKKMFRYDSTADTLATINTAGYFNNTDDNIRMVAGDLIYVKASNTTAVLVVSSVSSGSVTTAVAESVVYHEDIAGSTATLTASATGITNLTSTGVQTVALTIPFAGAYKSIIKTGASTAIITVTSGSTAVTFNGTNTNLTFDAAGEAVVLTGLSATRWAILSNEGTVGAS